MTDEETLRALPDKALTAEQRAALDHALARLEAAEKACRMVAASLSPKARASAPKKTYWFDVAIALKQWQDLADPVKT